MKTCLSAAVVLLLVCFPEWLRADESPSLMVRTRVETIEVSRDRLDQLLFGNDAPADDAALRAAVGKLMAEKQASLVALQTLTATDKFKGTAESIREFIYPTEWENPDMPEKVEPNPEGKPTPLAEDFATGPFPSAWDTRSLGNTLEVEARIIGKGSGIALRMVNEFAFHEGNETWMECKDPHGAADLKMPRFAVQRTWTQVRLRPGVPCLVSTLSPKRPDGMPDLSRKMMVFARCDIVAPPGFALPADSGDGEDEDENFDPFADPSRSNADDGPNNHTPDPDPFAAKPKPSIADDDNKKDDPDPLPDAAYRTEVEYISVPRETFAGMLPDTAVFHNDNAIHQKAVSLLKSGEATLDEAFMATAKVGAKAIAESVREVIYATEYEPPELPKAVKPKPGGSLDPENLPEIATPPAPSAWDTRNVGPTLECECADPSADGYVDVRLVPESVRLIGETVWREWKSPICDAPVKMPDFFFLRTNTSVRARSGHWTLAAAIPSLDAGGFSDPSRVVMIFVRTTRLVIPVTPPPEENAVLCMRAEFFEVPLGLYPDLVSSADVESDNTALRSRLLEMVESNKASLTDTFACVSKPGQKATSESIQEFIYPTEWEPAELPIESANGLAEDCIPPTPSAWDTRYLGTTMEIEGDFYSETGIIETTLFPEKITHTGDRVFCEWKGKAKGTIRMPTFNTLRSNGLLMLAPGKPQLVAALTPFGKDGNPDPSRKILVIATCTPEFPAKK